MTTHKEKIEQALFDVLECADSDEALFLFAALKDYRDEFPVSYRRAQRHPFVASMFNAIQEAADAVGFSEGCEEESEAEEDSVLSHYHQV